MNVKYTIKPGDTLYGISNQYGVSVSDLLSLNNVDPQNLKIGQEIIIPSNSGTNPDNIFEYVVKSGDTLYGISKKYDVSVNDLIRFNNLNFNILSIGQILKIPENYSDIINDLPSYFNYTVKKGDTLYKIAIENNIDLDTLMKDNGLTSNILKIGQVLKIRDNDSFVEECFGSSYIPVDDITYTVKKGDTLYSISKYFNITTSDLYNYNNLKSNTLSIGQVLKIPSNSNIEPELIYIVKKGDSLYSIAKKYNTTVDSIKKKNNLKSNILSIGQELKI